MSVLLLVSVHHNLSLMRRITALTPSVKAASTLRRTWVAIKSLASGFPPAPKEKSRVTAVEVTSPLTFTLFTAANTPKGSRSKIAKIVFNLLI